MEPGTKKEVEKINEDFIVDLFLKELSPIETKGFGIFWQNKRMKCKEGLVDSYASFNSAIEALKRNSQMHSKIKDALLLEKYGFGWTKNREQFTEYFWKPQLPNGTSGGWYSDERWKEYKLIESTAHNALGFFIKQWLKSGDLTIKQL